MIFLDGCQVFLQSELCSEELGKPHSECNRLHLYGFSYEDVPGLLMVLFGHHDIGKEGLEELFRYDVLASFYECQK